MSSPEEGRNVSRDACMTEAGGRVLWSQEARNAGTF